MFGNLLAGMQIALTHPFRIDDMLHVDGKWCWVEEVMATCVVLRVWDLRRLVIPLDWFITNHFENWSRLSAELMGTVFLWMDYAMPVQVLRDKFARLLRAAPKWHGKTENILVTDASDRAMEVRFLISAANSTTLRELRCSVREDLIAFVREHYPRHQQLRTPEVRRSGQEAGIEGTLVQEPHVSAQPESDQQKAGCSGPLAQSAVPEWVAAPPRTTIPITNRNPRAIRFSEVGIPRASDRSGADPRSRRCSPRCIRDSSLRLRDPGAP